MISSSPEIVAAARMMCSSSERFTGPTGRRLDEATAIALGARARTQTATLGGAPGRLRRDPRVHGTPRVPRDRTGASTPPRSVDGGCPREPSPRREGALYSTRPDCRAGDALPLGGAPDSAGQTARARLAEASAYSTPEPLRAH